MVRFGLGGPDYPRVGGFLGFWALEGLLFEKIRSWGFTRIHKNTRIHDTHVYMLYSMHVTYAIHMYTYIYICGHVRARTPQFPGDVLPRWRTPGVTSYKIVLYSMHDTYAIHCTIHDFLYRVLYSMHATYAIHAHRDFNIGAVSPALSPTCILVLN